MPSLGLLSLGLGRHIVAGDSLQAETTAFLSTLDTEGGAPMSAAQQSVLDAFMVSMKADGLLDGSKVKSLRLHAIHDRIAARINVIDQTTMTIEGVDPSDPIGWTTAGFNPGNITGVSEDLVYDPSLLPQNDICIGAYLNSTSGDLNPDLLSTDNTVRIDLRNTVLRGRLNVSGNQDSGTTAAAVGFYAMNRTASTTTTFYGPSGTSIGTDATASATPTANYFKIGNVSGSTADRDLAMTFIATGMDATDIQNLRDNVHAFVTDF